MEVVMDDGEGMKKVYIAGLLERLEEVIVIVERELERVLDRYEGVFQGSRKEAAERMKWELNLP